MRQLCGDPVWTALPGPYSAANSPSDLQQPFHLFHQLRAPINRAVVPRVLCDLRPRPVFQILVRRHAV